MYLPSVGNTIFLTKNWNVTAKIPFFFFYEIYGKRFVILS